jgi:hypothetical protein
MYANGQPFQPGMPSGSIGEAKMPGNIRCQIRESVDTGKANLIILT